jgi:hypothetical protein
VSQEENMSNNVIHTKSTSLRTAEVSDIILRDNQSTRLIFRPMIIDNAKNIEASVKGVFLYQKKSTIDLWEDFDTIPLTSVKKGEGYKLEIKSSELLLLTDELKELYGLYRAEGIPRGEKNYVRETPQLKLINGLSSSEISTFLNTNITIGTSLLTKLLNWAIKLGSSAESVVEVRFR